MSQAGRSGTVCNLKLMTYFWNFLLDVSVFIHKKSEAVDKGGLVYDEHFWFLLYIVYDYSKKTLKSRKLYVKKNINFTKHRKRRIIIYVTQRYHMLERSTS